jgi:organic hydroperoxide reductase OsmC/OhrA
MEKNMHQYEATVVWNRNSQIFSDNKYSRGHEWIFDGGMHVPASASPLIVPEPLSIAANVDPEEALVAAASSCHMLVFLYVAYKKGYIVDSYHDQAICFMEKNSAGKQAITRITLRPKILFSGQQPTPTDLENLHHTAHEDCYIANSIKAEIVVEKN